MTLRATQLGNSGLLGLVMIAIFVVPILPLDWHRVLFGAVFTVIFFVAALSLERHQRRIIIAGIALTAVEWISHSLDLYLLSTASDFAKGSFFVYIVFRLIRQIARTTEVNGGVIFEAINGYLMLGMAFSIAVGLVHNYNPAAYNFQSAAADPSLSKYLYYGFVTMTTVGYGDVVPQTALARSLAMLAGVVGQLYVAIIIAMLVGKFASRR